jgi:hypothetical protein
MLYCIHIVGTTLSGEIPFVLLSSQLGDSALSLAAGFHNTDCVRLLLEFGADKDAVDNVRNNFRLCIFVGCG